VKVTADVNGPTVENLIVVGSGAAGYTAALYAARDGLEPLVIEGSVPGGELSQTSGVENYPGFPNGVMGPDMMRDFRDQAQRFKARFITDDATRLVLTSDGTPHWVIVDGVELQAWAIVLAMGAAPRRLTVPGEQQLYKRGLSYCSSDAVLRRARRTVIVGGGDLAMEEAIFLSAVSVSVSVVHRRNEFRASRIMFQRARAFANVEFLTPFTIESFHPAVQDGPLKRVVMRNAATGETVEKETDHAVVAIGSEPNSAIVAGQVELDVNGYVVSHSNGTQTSVPGVFAAGALTDSTYRQAVTAASSGCQAALDAERYLRDRQARPSAVEGRRQRSAPTTSGDQSDRLSSRVNDAVYRTG
jgi:thioredoxin reductase (NADPH)